MMKVKRLTNFKLPYVVLISKFIEHFGVDVEEELKESNSLLIHVSTLNMHKMEFTKIGNTSWLKEITVQTLKLEQMTMKRELVEETKGKMNHNPWQLNFITLLRTLDLHTLSLRQWFSTNF